MGRYADTPSNPSPVDDWTTTEGSWLWEVVGVGVRPSVAAGLTPEGEPERPCIVASSYQLIPADATPGMIIAAATASPSSAIWNRRRMSESFRLRHSF